MQKEIFEERCCPELYMYYAPLPPDYEVTVLITLKKSSVHTRRFPERGGQDAVWECGDVKEIRLYGD